MTPEIFRADFGGMPNQWQDISNGYATMLSERRWSSPEEFCRSSGLDSANGSSDLKWFRGCSVKIQSNGGWKD
jgi:hypothetical protein